MSDNNKIPYIGKLFNNLNINESIIDSYYSLTIQPKAEDKISKSYTGKSNWFNNPFQYNIFGAYPLKHDYELLEVKINDDYFEKLGISKEDIDFYLKEYSMGFKTGYYDFENDIVKSKSNLFDEKTDFSRTIYDFATGSFFKGAGYPERYGSDNHILSGWFEAGKESGYFYRAWYIILSHGDRFKKYFKRTAEKSEEDFINYFIKGIHSLQKLDLKAECIRKLKSGSTKNENDFRDWFIPWFEGKYNSVFAEPEKGYRRIDLKIDDNIIGTKIIEFKGWWNSDKTEIIDQLTDYLTEFDNIGYVFMINHLKNLGIKEKYKNLVTCKNLKYKDGSWKEIPYKNTGFKYFKTLHEYYGGTKEIYHFIYRLNK